MRLGTALVGVALAAVVSAAPPASAQTTRRARTDQRQQTTVTQADIQRLQDTIYDVSGDISRLRQQDASGADAMQGQLDDLRDEAIYLKVKLRKEGSVPRNDYWDLRDRLDSLRSDVRTAMNAGGEARYSTPAPEYGGSTRPSSSPEYGSNRPLPPPPPPSGSQDRSSQPNADSGDYRQPRSSNPNEVPSGTELDVKLQNPLSSKTAQVEDRFEATTVVDLTNGNGRVLVPAGSIVRGVVTSVDKATRTDRKGSLTLSFDQVTVNGRSYPIHATVTQALESEGIRGEAVKIGTGAGVGAIIGGILGGVKGALAGILIGGGGTVLATPGKDVELQPGTLLRVQFDSPLVIR
ncbi:MAG: hypothetical protein ACM3NQ_13945 [Bacteroidales bacterium]